MMTKRLNRCGHWGVYTCVPICSLSWVEFNALNITNMMGCAVITCHSETFCLLLFPAHDEQREKFPACVRDMFKHPTSAQSSSVLSHLLHWMPRGVHQQQAAVITWLWRWVHMYVIFIRGDKRTSNNKHKRQSQNDIQYQATKPKKLFHLTKLYKERIRKDFLWRSVEYSDR